MWCEKNGVCSGVNLLGRSGSLCRLLLVACCLLLVACCLLLVAKNCAGRTGVCQVLCNTFMRFVMRKCVTVIGALFCHQYIVYHGLAGISSFYARKSGLL